MHPSYNDAITSISNINVNASNTNNIKMCCNEWKCINPSNIDLLNVFVYEMEDNNDESICIYQEIEPMHIMVDIVKR